MEGKLVTRTTHAGATPIVFSVDDNYVRPLSTAIRSLGHHTGTQPVPAIIVLHSSMSSAGRQRLEAQAADVGLSIEFRQVDPVYATYAGNERTTSATYFRLAIPDVLPEHARALYLDCDILITGPLRDLMSMEMGSAPLAAVRDPLNPILRGGTGLPGWEQLGLSGEQEYFNAGVVLMNLSACREREVFKRAAWFIENKRAHMAFVDQCALNWALDDAWLRLAPRWNTMVLTSYIRKDGSLPHIGTQFSADMLAVAEREAHVLHFAGPRKPWNGDYPPVVPREIYRSVLAEVDACSVRHS
jgi:lipopolysaccharide biosynthesis glycosyltransferase